MTIFYYLRFDTPQPETPGTSIYIPKEQGGSVIQPGTEGSLFVASYDSQGYGGNIRPRLHTGRLYSPAVTMENVGCSFVPVEIFVASSLTRKRVLFWVDLYESTPTSPWKRALISQQPSGFQESYVRENVCQIRFLETANMIPYIHILHACIHICINTTHIHQHTNM
jgi:hypothetical protein